MMNSPFAAPGFSVVAGRWPIGLGKHAEIKPDRPHLRVNCDGS